MRRFTVFGMVLLLSLLMAAPAAATRPVPGTGTYAFDITCWMDEGIPLRLDGTLTGCASVYVREHGSDKAMFVGAVVLDGETYTGTASINFSATDRFSIKGTGDLKGLHGQGVAVDDPSGLTGVYAGRFHFHP